MRPVIKLEVIVRICNFGDDSKGNLDQHALMGEGLDSVQQLNVLKLHRQGKGNMKGVVLVEMAQKNPSSISKQKFLLVMLMISPRDHLKGMMRGNIV
jgi:aryl carrier-like protein